MKKTLVLLLGCLLITGYGCKQKEKTPPTLENKESKVEKPVNANETLNYTLQFTAFKTPKKIGVTGSFNDIVLNDIKTTGTISELLTGATFNINTASINTKDPGRDAKLKEFFFDNLSNQTISGKFESIENGQAIISIQMNNVEKHVAFQYTSNDDTILFNGSIDIIKDFSANKAFNGIHEACKILHEGKTWSDVNLLITVAKK